MKLSPDDLVESAEMASPRSPAEDLPTFDLTKEIPTEQKKITQFFHYVNKGCKRLRPSFDVSGDCSESQPNRCGHPEFGEKSGRCGSGKGTLAKQSSVSSSSAEKSQESISDNRSGGSENPDDRGAAASLSSPPQRRQTRSSVMESGNYKSFRSHGRFQRPETSTDSSGRAGRETTSERKATKKTIDTIGFDDDIDDADETLKTKKKSPRLKVDATSDDDDDDDEVEENELNKNLEFYMNERMSQPNGDYIDIILEEWKYKYDKLEDHHGYIQWLFPIRENGMNGCAQVLQEHEAKAIRESRNLKKRVLNAYKMMLNFYGLRLVDDATGVVGPASERSHFNKRIKHLNSSCHNNLRITRILKSLGELGFERLKKPLVEYLLDQVFVTKLLNGCRRSCTDYWIPTLANKEDQERLQAKAKKITDKTQKYSKF